MKFNLKQIYNPLICAMAGLFNFIFMFMNYATVFASIYGQKFSNGFSGYEALKFGDESIGANLEYYLEDFGKDANTFLLVIGSILLILMIIISVGLILLGGYGLARELAGINLIPNVEAKDVNRISKLVLNIYYKISVVQAVFLLGSCLLNLYTGKYDEIKIKLGLKPGIGMFFLLIFAIAEWVVLKKLEKRFADGGDTADIIYKCSACGAKAKSTDKFCNVCGGPIATYSRATYKCSSCGTIAKPTDKFCNACGSPVIPVGKTIYKCSACGIVAKETDKFCNVCGAAIVSVEMDFDESVSDSTNNTVKNFDYSAITNLFKKDGKK